MPITNDRFWAKVRKTNSCWIWTASPGAHGHGQFSVGGRPVVVTRYVWENTHGAIPEGASVRQTCGVDLCMNPDHLALHEHRGHVNKRPISERFFEKVKKSSGCWKWTGGHSMGYGHLTDGNGGHIRAHRYSWIFHNGPVPDGLFVCHKCNNKNCVNPDHLYLATSHENSIDARRDGLMKTGEQHHGARLIKEDILEIRKMRANGVPLKEIMQRFGISQSHASGIIRRIFWKDV